MEKESNSGAIKPEEQNWQGVKSRKNLYLLGITYMMNMASYQGVLGLESSINVEEGLGTISVMIIFITSAVSCVTFVPCLVDFFGAKKAIIAGEIGMITYLVANFFPNWYTIIIASIFHGLTESAPWCGTSVYVSLLGKQRWLKKSKKVDNKLKSVDVYVVRFFGRFYALNYTGNVLGFGLMVVVLMAFDRSEETKLTYSYNNTTQETLHAYERGDIASNESFKMNLKLAKCGAKDCQIEYIYNSTEEQLENYNPDPTGTYVLLGLFVSIALTGVILQALFLTPSPAKFDVHESNENSLPLENQENVKVKKLKMLNQELYDIFKHLISSQHLLIAPLVFYNGFLYGFAFTEYTRAFVSCTVGVEKVGLALGLFSISAIFSSFASPTIAFFIGRKWFICVMGVMHAGSYIVCLFWIPNQRDLWVAYAIGMLLGICKGSVVSLFQGLISLYFDKRLGIAYSVQNLVTNLGIVASTSWGTSLCSYEKIYIQCGCLALALFSVVAAEVRFKSMTQTERL